MAAHVDIGALTRSVGGLAPTREVVRDTSGVQRAADVSTLAASLCELLGTGYCSAKDPALSDLPAVFTVRRVTWWERAPLPRLRTGKSCSIT
jgi:hypothetical protein